MQIKIDSISKTGEVTYYSIEFTIDGKEAEAIITETYDNNVGFWETDITIDPDDFPKEELDQIEELILKEFGKHDY